MGKKLEAAGQPIVVTLPVVEPRIAGIVDKVRGNCCGLAIDMVQRKPVCLGMMMQQERRMAEVRLAVPGLPLT